MSRVPRHVKTRRQPSRNRPRQIAAVIAIGGCLGFAGFSTDAYITAKQKAAVAKAAVTLVATGNGNDDEIYTGSILFMPESGVRCRQLLFNNQNGLFSDNGSVDCDRAAYRGMTSVSETSAKYWPVARVQVISDGFRSH
jgi:hypothetical protein